jgi:hypothetical protein
MRRSGTIVHQQMKQGLNGLATVASVAPLVGIFGTLIGIANSFPGIAGQKGAVMGIIFGRLWEACVPTALGLLVAVPSLCGYKYLVSRVESIDREMENASLELVNLLSVCPIRLVRVARVNFATEGPIFRDEFGDQLREERRPWYRSSVVVVGMLIASSFVQIARYFASNAFLLGSAVGWACVYVIFTFAISWFAAYPVWVKVLRRTSGGMAALASLLCLCWSLAELLFSVHFW